MIRPLFLCGDVMTGRGVDQILPHPGRPNLYEPVVHSAVEYVALAERAHGTIARPVDFAYVWGAALDELDARQPAARIINLETSITTSERAAPKGINYRMHPANTPVLSAARIDCASLANNHVLDWAVEGLNETLDSLSYAGIRLTGAGRTLAQAEAPAILDLGDQGRVLVFALAADDSGVPPEWAAAPTKAGVNYIADVSERTIGRVRSSLATFVRAGDVVVVSVHWGANWGYEIPDEHRRFARALIDTCGVDLVWGHSSHHVKGIEVHRGRAILYGCGDFLNDYEGIDDDRVAYRADLTMMYFPTVEPRSGELLSLELVPLMIRNFRLQYPSEADARWLVETLDRESRAFGSRVVLRDGRALLEWPS
jgi:poly-gamma-glutamate capsule biosynthesis protein CapA/YwtB (metallophosphatase superfamily)